MAKYKPPKIYKYGRGVQVCRRCGSRDAVIQAYGLYLCRQCFREVASVIGFKKYE
ncbi:MAG: 30S ribosomal protein S14 [Desulfurococcus sp.]|jgi:small subunit ribosomal protein S14|uniref:Small ribosomal subunit protein uS14 n=2 Tax=Desulfurococcus amylolyticus TaxID=94694 RepID=B8D5V6_DESA1|nr:30S ribosomal protein S14 [Desulfurococcus amylolyticus]ACL11487.1 30S ribosomal protein S14P [Desulfurococcus amylolyticus 1221n]AFL67140.1 ribosomal protein S14 [Desulfurococcus amylolyticus DSM 16532]